MDTQEEIKQLKRRISELEEQEKKERGFPKYYDGYWYIDTTGDIYNENWQGFEFEEAMLEIGNVFKTKEQAEFVVEKLKVEAELRKFSRPFEENEYNSFIEIYMPDKTLEVDDCGYWQKQGGIYFESDKKAQQAIDAVGEDRIKKYIFGVEG